MITWSLFIMWGLFNLVDIAISWVAVQSGASEIGVLYQLSGAWWNMVVTKMILALIIGGVLVYTKKNDWLALLNLGMAGLCIYNGWALLRQITG